MKSSVIAALCAAPLAFASAVAPQLVEKDVVVVQAKSEDIIIIWTNNGGGAATTTLAQTKSVTATAAATAATHTVVVGGTVGGKPNLVYTPDSVEAAIGDMVIFEFMAQNHTVTQSAFATPCEKLLDGMDSGFMANINGTVNPPPAMAVQVTVDTPQWFYCRQAGHCGKGMTFSINPTAAKTQQMFQSMAIAQNGTGTASAITGGTSSGATSGTSSGTSSGTNAGTSSVASAAPAAAASIASGSGSIGTDGSCSCSCLCGAADFPSAAQGIGMFGGVSGAMPRGLLEI